MDIKKALKQSSGKCWSLMRIPLFSISVAAWLAWGIAAPAEEETSASKAAAEVIESLQGALGNLAEFRSLPPGQRVAWVREKSEQYVQDKVLSATKDALAKAMEDYAKAAFRAKAFETIAVPALKNALVAGLPLDWSQLEARMLAETDTKTRAYGLAMTGVSIAWDSVDAFSESGANAGFSKLAAGVCQAVAEAYIPGWGWFQLGVTMAEGLGKFVMNYATDTAIQGMLNDMFGMKSEPERFCQMLQTADPGEIARRIEDHWELVASGFVWEGQGTDAGEQAMKQRLKDTMMDLKAQIAQQVGAQRKKDAELRAAMQPFLDAAANAEARLKDLAAQTARKAKPMLDTIQAFDRKINAVNETQAQGAATTYGALAQGGAGGLIDLIPYTPLPRTEVIGAFNLAYDMCTSGLGGSFSGQAYNDQLAEAQRIKLRIVGEQPWPPDWTNNPGIQVWWYRQGADKVALDNEIEVLRLKARQRIGQQEEALRHRIAELAAEIRAGETNLENGLQAIEKEGKANLLQPDTFIRFFPKSYSPLSPNYTEKWLYTTFFILSDLSQPVELKYNLLTSTLGKLESDRSMFLSLDGKRKALYRDFQTLVAQIDGEMKTTVPAGCQDFRIITNGPSHVELRWNITNYLSTMPGEIAVLAAQYVRPNCVDDTLNIDTCMARIKGHLSGLQNEFDLIELRKRVQKVAEITRSKLAPYAIPGSDVYTYAAGLKGKVNDWVDYRQPIERTDLVRFAGLLEAAWEGAQLRIALLKKFSGSVDPTLLAGLLKNGENLATLKKVIAFDQQDRANAPALAANLAASYQNILKRWPETPSWGWTISDYEDAIGGMAGTLRDAQSALRTAKSAGSPIYTLLEGDLVTYIAKLTTLLNQYQTAYAKDAPSFGKAMPNLAVESETVAGARGQALAITPQVNETGGTFSCPNLPAGLSINAKTGAITGSPSQASWRGDIVITYTGTSGITARLLVNLQIKDPEPVTLGIRLIEGVPLVEMKGEAGTPARIQTRKLETSDWWVTVGNVVLNGAAQIWTDTASMGRNQRFYRIICVP